MDAAFGPVRGWVEGTLALAYVYLFDEWVSFLMQRKQMLGIMARAEGRLEGC